MNRVVLMCEGIAGPFECGHVGQYLESCDFEAYGGRGFASFTSDYARAMKFGTVAEALAYWKTQSKTVPLRPDGKPNRPLTAYHMTIEEK